MSHATERPFTDNRTRLVPPADNVRYLVLRAATPLGTFKSFGDFINDEDRDIAYQGLVKRLTGDWPDAWIQATQDEADTRLRASLSTDADRELFCRLGNHQCDEAAIRESAAYLVGQEVGRQNPAPVWRQPGDSETPPDTANTTDQSVAVGHPHIHVDDTLISVIGRIWLAIATVHAELGDVADVSDHAWYALSTLLEQVATDLEAARSAYYTEHNPRAAAADERGAA